MSKEKTLLDKAKEAARSYSYRLGDHVEEHFELFEKIHENPSAYYKTVYATLPVSTIKNLEDLVNRLKKILDSSAKNIMFIKTNPEHNTMDICYERPYQYTKKTRVAISVEIFSSTYKDYIQYQRLKERFND